MTWIKFEQKLINLEDVKEITIDGAELYFWFNEETELSLLFESEEEANKCFEYLIVCLQNGINFIDFDKIVQQNKQNK